MRLFKREFVISVQMNSYSPSPPNRTHNYCTMRVTSSRVHVIYKKRHVSCCVTNTKMLFDLWPRKSGGSPVISVPPLPQYICLDGSMRTWPARDRHDFTIRPSKRLYSCATDENVKGCKNILVSGRIIRKREWTVIG